MSNPLDEMMVPCPMDICDGSGICPGFGDEDDRECPHVDSGEDRDDD